MRHSFDASISDIYIYIARSLEYVKMITDIA